MDKIYIASDHAGFKAKSEILKILKKFHVKYEDLGPENENPVDYPEFAKKVSEKVIKENSKGILICGSGTGMQIAANKFKGIRAVFAYDEYSAKMARLDNDANILTLRSRDFDHEKYKNIILSFIDTEFSHEERHLRRINEIKEIENKF